MIVPQQQLHQRVCYLVCCIILQNPINILEKQYMGDIEKRHNFTPVADRIILEAPNV